MRVVEDHHVDRPDVEARQRVKLTGPNHSNGLISNPRPAQRRASGHLRTARSQDGGQNRRKTQAGSKGPAEADPGPRARVPIKTLALTPSFDGLVAMARGSTPDPIPNSAVKTLSADGTAS